ncbi:hypothetical protein M514_09701 [Trichuris suis]|uniref:Uncharacterized protein n=1 Tax=Trichuris suis TaxID=68888 RepID=A0A085LWT8_9BILA|nr:hypothetical protein M513_09701 [Trichuris suis]KFD63649.1 hypothetical protein M514_09701 [Trichuris suis]KHJ45112.1 hypothetical protein D918_04416 [Trichuris suis]
MHIGLLLLFSAVLIWGTYGRAFWWNKYATNSESEEMQYAWPPRQGKNQKDVHKKSKPSGGHDVPMNHGRSNVNQRMPWEQLEADLAGNQFARGDYGKHVPTSFDVESLFKPQPDEGWQWEDPDFQDWDKPSPPDKTKKDRTSGKHESNGPNQRQRFFWLAEKPHPRNGLSQERRIWVLESRSWDTRADQNKTDTKREQDKEKPMKRDIDKPKDRDSKAPIRSPVDKKKRIGDSSSLNEGRRSATAHERRKA